MRDPQRRHPHVCNARRWQGRASSTRVAHARARRAATTCWTTSSSPCEAGGLPHRSRNSGGDARKCRSPLSRAHMAEWGRHVAPLDVARFRGERARSVVLALGRCQVCWRPQRERDSPRLKRRFPPHSERGAGNAFSCTACFRRGYVALMMTSSQGSARALIQGVGGGVLTVGVAVGARNPWAWQKGLEIHGCAKVNWTRTECHRQHLCQRAQRGGLPKWGRAGPGPAGARARALSCAAESCARQQNVGASFRLHPQGAPSTWSARCPVNIGRN